MKRLTERNFIFTTNFVKRSIDAWSIAQCLKKLQKYEDTEDDGLMIVLPCKVGDTVWNEQGEKLDVYKVCITYEKDENSNPYVICLDPDRVTYLYYFSDFGKKVFTSQEIWQQSQEVQTGNTACSKFECEDMGGNGCRFDDEIVVNSCSLCDIYCKCDRCKHKEQCKLRDR